MFLSSLLFSTSFPINEASELISQNFLVSKKEKSVNLVFQKPTDENKQQNLQI